MSASHLHPHFCISCNGTGIVKIVSQITPCPECLDGSKNGSQCHFCLGKRFYTQFNNINCSSCSGIGTQWK